MKGDIYLNDGVTSAWHLGELAIGAGYSRARCGTAPPAGRWRIEPAIPKGGIPCPKCAAGSERAGTREAVAAR